MFSLLLTDIDAAIAAIVRHGGTITLEKFKIPTVGTIVEFEDPERNTVCAMQYV